MDDLHELYQEVILEHHKRPRNFRALPQSTHRAAGHNPLCGDEVEVYLTVRDGRIAEVTFQGQGCAISRASASLMTEALTGKRIDEARKVFAGVKDALTGNAPEAGMDEIGELAALQGVRRFPARIKCATLPWHAFEAAVAGTKRVSTEA
ncbi:MAG: SUF system NifU family Fe-S cluster assembly protein [Opitutales bacterium]|nr:SUF system NifU family Fe-S cluster assembly protein [Opitutales bacterium]